jgi:S1-C subfamily serine protease
LAYEEEKVLEVIENVTRSVVNINTVRVFQDVFYRVVPVQGMGSGFIFDEKGYVLTNNHVIQGAERIGVTLVDKRVLEGRLVGVCRSTDAAIVRVNAGGLTAAELGDSDKLRVGQRVFAIGNPFGLTGGPSVTAGVISAINRSIQTERGTFENLVQTDAAINPGNSGGPLVDIQGRVVAINTAIIPFAQGIGFAIPINSAKTCASEIQAHGAMIRPWLGVSGVTVTGEVASYYGIPADRGVLVMNVVGDSPAQRSGIRAGDVILGVAGSAIGGTEDLQRVVQERKVGDVVDLLVLRENRRWVVKAELDRTP